jgi:hercynylcysteine S-oxide lyase
LPIDGIHLDSAAAGRQSRAVLDAAAAHARAEAQHGAYVAEAAAAEAIDRARVDVASLIGMTGDCVAFMQSASDALHALLELWPLHDGDAIGVLPDEWGPNLQAFQRRGLRVVELPTAPDGQADPTGLAQLLRTSALAAVHVVLLNPHRPIVQPVEAMAEACAAAGVPLWVDAAQAVGHVNASVGADAIYAPGRKWLAGPRGAAIFAIRQQHWDRLRSEPPVLHPDTPVMQRLENDDANVAARVGLAAALRELHADQPAAVWQRLAEIGAMTRAVLGSTRGWGLGTTAGALTVMYPDRGQNVVATRAALLAQHRILTTASPARRAPRLAPARPALRISPHVDCTEDDLGRLRDALSAI